MPLSRHAYLMRCMLVFTGVWVGLSALDISQYFGPDAVLYASYRQTLRSQLLEKTLGSYRERGIRDERWDADLERLLPMAVDYFLKIPNETDKKDALAIANRLYGKKIKCRDPLVHWAAFVLAWRGATTWQIRNGWCNRGMNRWKEDDAVGLHWRLLHIQLLNHSLSTWARSKAENAAATRIRINRSITRELVAALAEATDDDLPILLHYVDIIHPRVAEGAEIMFPAVDEALGNSQLSPPARAALRAELAARCAWIHRGSGWGSEVGEDGWKNFRRYLAIADADLEAAWAGGVRSPVLARTGLAVAGPGHGTASIHVWFERGLSMHPDSIGLYGQYRNFLRPRWGGSFDAMLRLAEAAVATERFDTEVPWVVVTTMERIIKDAHAAKQERPLGGALADRAIAAIDRAIGGYLERNPGQLARYTCYRASVRYHAGRDDEAIALLKTLDRDDLAAALERINQKGLVWYMDPIALLDGAKGAVEDF